MDSTLHFIFVSSWPRSLNIPSTASRNSCPGTSSRHSGQTLPKPLSHSPNRCPLKNRWTPPKDQAPKSRGDFQTLTPQTIQFVDRHPNQVFILDHIAKPRIRDRVLSPWKENLTELACRQNVYCKLSGLVTEANWHTWSGEDL